MKVGIAKRVIAGIIMILAGVTFYGWHLLEEGRAPHFFWAVVGGVIALSGIWIALSRPSMKDR